MNRLHFWKQLLVILTVSAMVLAGGCGAGPAATEAPVETESPNQPSTSIEFFLPDFMYGELLQAQLDEFTAATGIQVNLAVLPYPDLMSGLTEKAASGSPPALAGIPSEEVINFAKGGYLISLNEWADFGVFREDLLAGVRIDENIYGFPWRGYSCHAYSFDLAVFSNQPEEGIAAAARLGEFLTRYESQIANLDQLGWFSTVNQIYADRGLETCLQLNFADPVLIEEARTKAANFSGVLGIEFDDSKAVALDAAEVGGQPGTLASAMAPARTDNQYYGDRLAFGYLNVNHDNIASFVGLPIGDYLIACIPEAWDCIAVNAFKEEIPLEPEQLYVEPSFVDGPSAFFEQGSIGGCIKIYDSVKVCVELF